MDEPGYPDRFEVASRLRMTVAELMEMDVMEYEGWVEFYKRKQGSGG